MLTIFGRKKKEEENKNIQPVGPNSPPTSFQQQQPSYGSTTPSTMANSQVGTTSDNSSTDQSQQDSPFAKIFQSISKDYQNQMASRPETITKSVSATPEWVQPMSLPPSKPMIITPQGARPKTEEGGWETNEIEEKESGEEGEDESTADAPKPTRSEPPETIRSSSPSHFTPSPFNQNISSSSTTSPTTNQSTGSSRPYSTPASQIATQSPGPFLKNSGGSASSSRPSVSGPMTNGPRGQDVSNVQEDTSRTVSSFQSATPKKPKDEEKESGKTLESSSAPSQSSGDSSSLITFDESPSVDFGNFQDLSKLLAETDSTLAMGREREKELSVDRPLPTRVEPKKSPEPKEEKKQVEDTKKPTTGKDGRGFEHLFDLARGGLDAPGLVVIDGSPGSGRTTVCLGLIDRYLKQTSPCIFVSYGQEPAKVREGLKAIGCDVANYESNYRFMIVDAYSAQSGGFSLELYSLMEPFDFSKLEESLAGNCGVFMGEKTRVIIDPVDGLAGKIGPKEFGKALSALVERMKSMNVTLIVSCDLSSIGKDARSSMEEGSECVLELEAGKEEHTLRVSRLKGEKLKADAEGYEYTAGKGLVFV